MFGLVCLRFGLGMFGCFCALVILCWYFVFMALYCKRYNKLPSSFCGCIDSLIRIITYTYTQLLVAFLSLFHTLFEAFETLKHTISSFSSLSSPSMHRILLRVAPDLSQPAKPLTESVCLLFKVFGFKDLQNHQIYHQ